MSGANPIGTSDVAAVGDRRRERLTMPRDDATIERRGGARRLALRCGLLLVMLGAAPVRGAPPNVVTMDIGDEPGRVSTEEVRIEDGPFARQLVFFRSNETPGTLVISTADRFLYLVLGNSRALRYGIGVGRDGFQWSGLVKISRKAEWPDWTPPPEMIARQPYLPRFMAGGPGNPMGARAMYLGSTVYRIHGTNQPETIGEAVSSGCFRLANGDVIDLFSRVDVGAKVIIRQAAQL
jgi:lipoprotein-anchoring transpeptidase ErfK/SrfK